MALFLKTALKAQSGAEDNSTLKSSGRQLFIGALRYITDRR